MSYVATGMLPAVGGGVEATTTVTEKVTWLRVKKNVDPDNIGQFSKTVRTVPPRTNFLLL